MPMTYGAVGEPRRPAKGLIIRGEVNCPRYRAAEIRGMTVVAAFLPPLMEAMVFRYGIPIPLASPTSAEPASRSGVDTPRE